MHEERYKFLKQLLSTPGPSCDEITVAHLWRQQARTFADSVQADVRGNSFAMLEGPGPRILLAGHIDEIGIMVSHIDDSGYLFFQVIGGWDTHVLVGQRVRLLTADGDVIGVVGRKPIHLIDHDERQQACKLKDLWIDIGAKDRKEALKRVQVGCAGVLDAPLYEFPHRRIVCRSLDNRIGTFVVLETLRLLAEAQERPIASVAAVATTQEETSAAGAKTAAFRFDPHVSLVVDVTWATDQPDSNKKEHGNVKLGGGPTLSRGAANSPLVYQRLVDIAEREHIPYSLQITPRYTGTDADAIYNARAGVATGLVSIPLRYMHTPNEMVDLADVEHTIQLMVAFVHSVQSYTEFIAE